MWMQGHPRRYSVRRRVARFPVKALGMHDLPQNWFVFRLSALGDVLLTTGVLRHWHAAHGWRFHVLTRGEFASIFDNNPVVDAVVSASSAELVMPRMNAWFGELAAQYKGWGLLDLHGTARSVMLGFRWKGPVRRYGKRGLARRAFLLSGGRVLGTVLREANVPQRYALAVDEATPPVPSLAPVLYLADEEKAWAKSFLVNLSGDDVLKKAFGQNEAKKKRIVIHPFASHSHKAWPGRLFERLVRLLEARGFDWLILGRGTPFFPGERRDLTGKTTLRESAALLAACSALVTGDSGLMHLATAVNTPVVALFGPTTKEWGFFPSGPRDRVLERALACRPCSLHGKKGCPRDGECLALIEPEEVAAALEEIFSGS